MRHVRLPVVSILALATTGSTIADDAPSCPEFADRVALVEPTWTPIPPDAIPLATLALGSLVEATPEVVEMEFVNEAASIQMGVPIQDVYIETDDGQVVRPQDLDAETLASPIYRTTVEVKLKPGYSAIISINVIRDGRAIIKIAPYRHSARHYFIEVTEKRVFFTGFFHIIY